MVAFIPGHLHLSPVDGTLQCLKLLLNFTVRCGDDCDYGCSDSILSNSQKKGDEKDKKKYIPCQRDKKEKGLNVYMIGDGN